MRRGILSISYLLVSLTGVGGCGGGSASQPPSSKSNPTPTVISISPNSVAAGAAAFTLTVNGTNYVTGTMIVFGGSALATTFVSSTQLNASIPASSIAAAGDSTVTVTNPAPGGGTSNSITFTVFSSASTAPTISLLAPSCAPAGEPVQLTVVGPILGQILWPSSVVRWNGSDRPTATNGALTDSLLRFPRVTLPQPGQPQSQSSIPEPTGVARTRRPSP